METIFKKTFKKKKEILNKVNDRAIDKKNFSQIYYQKQYKNCSYINLLVLHTKIGESFQNVLSMYG